MGEGGGFDFGSEHAFGPDAPGKCCLRCILEEAGSNPSDSDMVHIPQSVHKYKDIQELIFTIYLDLGNPRTSTPSYLTERTILAAKNDFSCINALTLDVDPGEMYTYLAADKISKDEYGEPSV